MKTEIEATFLNVNIDELREKLRRIGAKCEQPMRLMRRVVSEPPALFAKQAFVRVRDEGDKVTMTYKQGHNSGVITDPKEIEIVVSNFEDAVSILENAGLKGSSYQETKRETWKLGDTEVVIDEWPWLEPLAEIEGPSEARVKEVASSLGFDWKDVLIGAVTQAYQKKYPHGDSAQLVNVPRVTFDEPVPAIILGTKES